MEQGKGSRGEGWVGVEEGQVQGDVGRLEGRRVQGFS